MSGPAWDDERDESDDRAGEYVLGTLADDERQPVSYTHLRAHETVLDLVCRLLLEKKKQQIPNGEYQH